MSLSSAARGSTANASAESHISSNDTDIGYLDIMDIDRSTSNDQERLNILLHNWKPPYQHTFPYRQFGEKRRRFNSVWLTQWKFLRYSKSHDGVVCVYCYLFRHNDVGALISSPLCDWKNVTNILHKHMGDPISSLHSRAAVAAEDFIRVATGKQLNVVTAANKGYQQKREQNLAIMSSLLECIIFCGKQGIGLREHRLTEQSNPGNFRALVNFRAKTDKVLHDHLNNCPKNAQYLSPRIQNELIDICGVHVQEGIVADCQAARYFSVIADETTDVSTTEQLSICVRFVETLAKKVTIREEFLGFVSVTSTTGENIAKVILSSLSEWGLDIALLRGQGYDGASNMSGKFAGVQALVKQQAPLAVYLHCRAHSLNLAKYCSLFRKCPCAKHVWYCPTSCCLFRRICKTSPIISRIRPC